MTYKDKNIIVLLHIQRHKCLNIVIYIGGSDMIESQYCAHPNIFTNRMHYNM